MGDTTLTTFTVNNVAYDNTDEQSITVSPGTTSVPIDIVPPAGATYSVFLTTPTKDQDTATIANGNIEGLETGSNRINVMVEAFGGQGQRNYTFFVTVDGEAAPVPGPDNSLLNFLINGSDPLLGSFAVPYGTASVPIFV